MKLLKGLLTLVIILFYLFLFIFYPAGFFFALLMLLFAYYFRAKERKKEREINEKGVAEEGYVSWFAKRILDEFPNKHHKYLEKTDDEMIKFVNEYKEYKKLPDEYSSLEISLEMKRILEE